MMRELLWRAVAKIVSQPGVGGWLIRRAQRTPYCNITGPDGSVYMGRWWLFNPYELHGAGARFTWLPSIRVHHIMRPDTDRHLHDHPWNARTIILRNGYSEERPGDNFNQGDAFRIIPGPLGSVSYREVFHRKQGYTGRLLFGQYHRISEVSPGGAWTLFFSWGKRGSWGFNVDGVKVPWRRYLNEPEPASIQSALN